MKFILVTGVLGYVLFRLTFSLSAEALLEVAAVILSLLFSYAPGLAEWFNQRTGTVKRLIMLVVLVLATAAVYALACAGVISGVTCSKPGLIQVVQAFITAVIANQVTDRISPRIGAKASRALG